VKGVVGYPLTDATASRILNHRQRSSGCSSRSCGHLRRDDLSGWAKAGWILLIFVVPFIGILIYTIAGPKMTDQDRQRLERM
jgi:phospholipase D-like protein